MAKNRNKKKNGSIAMAVDSSTTNNSLTEEPQAMDVSETIAKRDPVGGVLRKVKNGRPMKRSKNVRKMKAVAKALSKSEKSVEKISKIAEELQRSSVDSCPSVERRDTGKYVRQTTSFSSSSGGEHPRRLSSVDCRWIQETIRESEDRAMQRIEKSIEDKWIPKMEKWFESFLEKTRCGCAHSTDTYTSTPRASHHPTTTMRDEEQQLSPDISRDSGHIEPVEPALHQPNDTPDYSLQIHGTSPGTASYEESAHYSMPGLDLFNDLTSQNVMRQTFEPM